MAPNCKHIPLLSSTLIFASMAIAQPEIEWLNEFDGGNETNDRFEDIYHLSGGGFAIAGTANGNANWNNGTILIAKADEDGEFIWTRLYQAGMLASIIEADNGDFVAGGFQPQSIFTACRVDQDGEPVWLQNYGGGRCAAIIELKEGDFLLGGRTNDMQPIAKIVRIDGEGNEVWSSTYRQEGAAGTEISAMRETDGGVVIAGRADRKAWVLKIDLDGESSWSHMMPWDGADYTAAYSMISSRQGGFTLAGRVTGLQNAPVGQPYLMKINADGEQVWLNHYNRNQEPPFRFAQQANGVIQQANGDYYLCGESYGFDDAPDDALIFRTNVQGQEQWRFFPRFDQMEEFQAGFPSFRSLVQATDRGIVVAGYANHVGTSYDAVILKLNTEAPGPILFYFLPEDTLFSVLPGDTVNFILRAMNRLRQEIAREWYFNDSLMAEGDTLVIVPFNDIEVDTIRCYIHEEDWANEIKWHVTVTDLYITSFTPDTLNLAIRRGSSIDFSLDTIRYTDGDAPEYLWTKSNLSNPEQEPEVAGTESRATVQFVHSGNYAVEGLAYRGESSDAVTWSVAVSGAIWSFAPEDLSLEVLPDSLVRFEVAPSEPENEELSIQWLVDGDVVGEDTTSFEWSFSGADLNPSYQVTVVVADTVEADTVVWEVVVRDLGIDNPTADPPRLAALLSVSPNPFNTLLTIRYSFAAINSGKQALAIYDISGREVARLWRDEGWGMRDEKAADRRGSAEGTRALEHLSTRALTWNASSVPAGVYLVRLQAGQEVSTRKIVLIR